MTGKKLIDVLEAAIEKAGGTRALSRLIATEPGGISDAKSGKSPISPYNAAQLAAVLGLDPIELTLTALEEQARSEEEKILWRRLKKREPLYSIDLRKIVEESIGPKYVFVIASALDRAGIHDHDKAILAAVRAKQFFDTWPNVFESGKSKIAIGDRRQLMADFLSGDERSAVVTAQRWNALSQS